MGNRVQVPAALSSSPRWGEGWSPLFCSHLLGLLGLPLLGLRSSQMGPSPTCGNKSQVPLVPACTHCLALGVPRGHWCVAPCRQEAAALCRLQGNRGCSFLCGARGRPLARPSVREDEPPWGPCSHPAHPRVACEPGSGAGTPSPPRLTWRELEDSKKNEGLSGAAVFPDSVIMPLKILIVLAVCIRRHQPPTHPGPPPPGRSGAPGASRAQTGTHGPHERARGMLVAAWALVSEYFVYICATSLLVEV